MPASRFPTVTDHARRRFAGAEWNGRLLDGYLDAVARSAPDALALVERQTRLSYARLAELVRRAAGGLRGLGVGRGDVVSFQLPNWWEALVLHHAVIRVGAVSNPLMPILRERELRYMLGTAGSRVLVSAAGFRGHDHAGMASGLRDELPDLEHLVLVRGAAEDALTFEELLREERDGHPEPGRGPDDPVVLLYTSGTESSPKGAVHSHDTLGYEVRSMITHFGLTGGDVVFMPSPVAHITGVLFGFHISTMLGSAAVYQDIWEPGAGLELIERERCGLAVAATPFLHGLTHHERLARHDVSSLRLFVCGGADVPPELVRTATERLGCLTVRAYGSTEFPTLSAGHADDDLDTRATTDGRCIGTAEARVVDEAGHELPPGTEGRLLARGPDLFLGYLGSDAPPTDDAGWFDTGDIAVIDDAGRIVISGRSKDIIVRGGENISAKEVEDLLYTHPDIIDVAVVAVPDPVLVERACAVVVPRDGAEVSVASLTAHLDGYGIARQKYPEHVLSVPELPRTPTGKVQKYLLRQRAAELRRSTGDG